MQVQANAGVVATADGELVRALAAGRVEALGELYDRHAPRMMAVAKQILGHGGDAEDLIHDVFLEVWQRAESYDAKRASVWAWLLSKVRSRALDRLRHLAVARRHQVAAPAVPEVVQGDPPLSRAVDYDAFRALPESQRTVLQLCYFRGLTCREIASHCGLPLGTVKSRLSTALNRLRSACGDRDGR